MPKIQNENTIKTSDEINIKQFLEELLNKLAVEFASIEAATELGQDVYRIKIENHKVLIGSDGDVLRAINHIVKKTAQSNNQETKFLIDVNDYRSKQIQEVQKVAKLLAERAQSLKYDVEMQPMSSYERMLVHTVLDDMDNITTTSIGAGRDRRVIIKYIE